MTFPRFFSEDQMVAWLTSTRQGREILDKCSHATWHDQPKLLAVQHANCVELYSDVPHKVKIVTQIHTDWPANEAEMESALDTELPLSWRIRIPGNHLETVAPEKITVRDVEWARAYAGACEVMAQVGT